MELTIPLAAPEAADADRFGAKAANLAALGQAGLPTPGGKGGRPLAGPSR